MTSVEVGVEAKTLIDPDVPAGTMAAFALIRPSMEFNSDTLRNWLAGRPNCQIGELSTRNYCYVEGIRSCGCRDSTRALRDGEIARLAAPNWGTTEGSS